MSDYFSTFQVAKLCRVSPATVSRWIRDGDLMASSTIGGHKRIEKENLMKLMRKLNIPLPKDLNGGGSGTASGRALKVLIVDDDEQIRAILKSFFERSYPESRVEEASEGFKAGWIAQGLKPDLILLDLMLPGFDGFKVCGFIRTFDELRGCKILAITGYGSDHEEKIREIGADDFLQKPFEMEVLKQRVENLVSL